MNVLCVLAGHIHVDIESVWMSCPNKCCVDVVGHETVCARCFTPSTILTSRYWESFWGYALFDYPLVECRRLMSPPPPKGGVFR